MFIVLFLSIGFGFGNGANLNFATGGGGGIGPVGLLVGGSGFDAFFIDGPRLINYRYRAHPVEYK
jgi:hypothetical protein